MYRPTMTLKNKVNIKIVFFLFCLFGQFFLTKYQIFLWCVEEATFAIMEKESLLSYAEGSKNNPYHYIWVTT